MTPRMAARAALLARAGWTGARVEPLAGDASARRYERLTRGRDRAVLMDADPARGEATAPFDALTDWLRHAGFSAPAILARDHAHGFLLLEDLGDRLFARVCSADPGAERGLYGAAVDLLVALHRLPAPSRVAGHALPCFDAGLLAQEVALVTDWYRPAASGQPTPADLAAAIGGRMAEAAALAPPDPVLVLRDFHAENLIWLEGRAGHGRVGLLDYQDAAIGHAAYDLVSLLEDARRDTGPALRQAMRTRYLAATGRDPEAFDTACAVLGAQRNLRILGVFARLSIRDGKPGYVQFMPRVWAHLMRNLAHPALAGLREIVIRDLPAPEPAVLARIRAARAA